MILIRHTTPAGAAGVCYGRLDLALAESFEAEAEAIAAALPPGPWRLFSSPATRCRRLAERLGPAVTIDERLSELDFGAWEGLRWDDIPPEQMEPWGKNFVTAPPPGGESFTELAARARAFAAEIVAQPDTVETVAVTHSGVIRALLTAARGMSLAEAFTLEVPFGSIHRI
ncbi:histidine phosphatase family protein [Magnetospirillum molischianum]|uniref:Alpha-ribazole phosphatase n=1 Tax=Magnetospirillum molischianum DSM 120 TaxID=1150626 RepID=H8FPC8_MAGML|nr:histidine phosphatase family protein [Magnetospirillum molischianum]CCG40216.1 Alpha-ribazole phosphatase [Magnetospirillum molischianum DSM 120]